MRFSAFSVADHYPGQRPRSLDELYEQILSQVELCEQLGYDSYFVAEHHFHEYGAIPSPSVFLAAAASRTSRIGLGIAVAVLPFHNPLRVAEEYAMLDRLSGGRLLLGVGSGYLSHEFDGFGVPGWEKRFRFDENLDVMLKAWSGQRFTHHGHYNHVQDVQLNVLPAQQPHPPYWIAILRPEAAYHIGKSGRNVMLIPYGTCDTLQDLKDVTAEFRRGWAESGLDDSRAECAAAFHTYVADDDATAAREAVPALDLYVDTRLYAKKRTFEELDREQLILFGSPDTVADRLGLYQDIGIDRVLVFSDFGAMGQDLAAGSLRRFAQHVIPKLAAPDPQLAQTPN